MSNVLCTSGQALTRHQPPRHRYSDDTRSASRWGTPGRSDGCTHLQYGSASKRDRHQLTDRQPLITHGDIDPYGQSLRVRCRTDEPPLASQPRPISTASALKPGRQRCRGPHHPDASSHSVLPLRGNRDYTGHHGVDLAPRRTRIPSRVRANAPRGPARSIHQHAAVQPPHRQTHGIDLWPRRGRGDSRAHDRDQHRCTPGRATEQRLSHASNGDLYTGTCTGYAHRRTKSVSNR
jgi:hypothetical protein